MFTIFLILCGSAIAATPLTPDGGTGYTVSGSIADGNISYTVTAAGEYELLSSITTTEESAIIIDIFGNGLVSINGNNHSISATTAAITGHANYKTININTTLTLSLSNILAQSNNLVLSGDKGIPSANVGGNGGHGTSVKLHLTNSIFNDVILSSGSGANGNNGQNGAHGIYGNDGSYAGASGGRGGDGSRGGPGGSGGLGGNIDVVITNSRVESLSVVAGQGGSGGKGGEGGGGGRGGKGSSTSDGSPTSGENRGGNGGNGA